MWRTIIAVAIGALLSGCVSVPQWNDNEHFEETVRLRLYERRCNADTAAEAEREFQAGLLETGMDEATARQMVYNRVGRGNFALAENARTDVFCAEGGY